LIVCRPFYLSFSFSLPRPRPPPLITLFPYTTLFRSLQTSAPHVYAVGDCAEVDGLFRPFVSPLMQAARALGKTLAGTPTAVRYPALPVVVKTPACPVMVYPSAVDDGQWQIEGTAPDLAASYMHNGELTGFALTGAARKQRGKFLK